MIQNLTKERVADLLRVQAALNKGSYSNEWILRGVAGEILSDELIDGKKPIDYTAAALGELGEFMGSLGYEWWTAKETDRSNCITELVDTLHFVLSQEMVLWVSNEMDLPPSRVGMVLSYTDVVESSIGDEPIGELSEETTECMMDSVAEDIVLTHEDRSNEDQRSVREQLRYTMIAVASGQGSVYEVLCLADSMGVSFDHLYARYMGKATLNAFRVENGYSEKPRRYKKMWAFEAGEDPQEDNYFLAQYIDSAPSVLNGRYPTQAEVREWLSTTYAQVK
jgi:hypothetical protein